MPFSRRVVLAALAVLALAVAGCTPSPPAPTVDGGALYVQGEQAYRTGQYAEAERVFGQYLAGDPRGEQAARAGYWRGMSRLALGLHDGAREDFRTAAARADSEMLRAMSLRGMGKSHFLQGRYVEAEAVWQSVLERHGRSIDQAEILRLLEESARQRGDAAAAQRHHAELARRFPDSPYLTAPVAADTAFRREGTSGAAQGHVTSGRYTVQAGVFADRVRAEALVRSLTAKGVEAALVPVTIGGGTNYAVRCGTFETRGAAMRRQARLDQLGIPSIIKE